MRKLLNNLIYIISITLFITNADSKTLTAAVADWTGGELTCQVAVSILENELGYTVKRKIFPSGTALWKEIADGNIDFACESWPSYAEADDIMLNDTYIQDGKVILDYKGDGSVELLGTSGIIGSSDYYVPRYFVDANPGFKDWKDLNKYKKQFSTWQTGSKGRLIGCPVAAWNCHDQKRLDLLGIDFKNEMLGTEIAVLKKAQTLYDRKEPFLLYLWEPHIFFGRNEMVPINLPDWKECPNFTQANNWRDCGKNAWPATGWQKDFTINYGNPKTFSDPYFADAKAFFKKMDYQNMDQSKMLVRVGDDGLSVNQAVEEWKRNTNDWKSWLPGSESSVTAIAKMDNDKSSELVVSIKKDETSPTIEIEDYFPVFERSYSISGKVFDENTTFVEANGNSWRVNNNSFTVEGSVPLGRNEIEIIAFDLAGNESSKKIIIDRLTPIAESNDLFEPLKPERLKSKINKNKMALIFGNEKYQNMSPANFARRDAELFIDYVQGAFGVSQKNIKYFFNAERNIKFEIKDWLKKNVRKDTEIYVYFSGHGMAQNNGRDLYLLTNDTMPQYINETALNRNEIFNDISKYNPKNVTVFLDTCYSGAGRADGEVLLAMAKGLVVVDENQQELPNNFTLFTAASAQESAWSLPEVKHGTFSYFLMKGMEGDADLDGDKKITNGELQEYLLDNVSRYAQDTQTPQMIGKEEKVLVKF